MIRTWHEPFDGRRVPFAGLLAAVVAGGLNVGVRAAAGRWLDVDVDHSPLSLSTVLVATVGGVFVACLVLAVLGTTQARPFTIFRRLAWIVFLVAAAAAMLAYLGWLPGVDRFTYPTLLVLVGMSAVTSISCVVFLTTLPRGRYAGGF